MREKRYWECGDNGIMSIWEMKRITRSAGNNICEHSRQKNNSKECWGGNSICMNIAGEKWV
jgi:hypothetical protein